MEHPIFNKIRNSHFEKPCPVKLKLKIYQESAYDYVNFKSIKYDMKDYKKML